MKTINPFIAIDYANLIRGGREQDSTSPYVFDPLTPGDRDRVQNLTTLRCTGRAMWHADIDALIVEILNPYLEKKRAGVVLKQEHVGQWCEIPPVVFSVLIEAADGKHTMYGGPYNLLVEWINACGYKVVCEYQSNRDAIVYDARGYTLVKREGKAFGSYPTLDRARAAHRALYQ